MGKLCPCAQSRCAAVLVIVQPPTVAVVNNAGATDGDRRRTADHGKIEGAAAAKAALVSKTKESLLFPPTRRSLPRPPIRLSLPSPPHRVSLPASRLSERLILTLDAAILTNQKLYLALFFDCSDKLLGH